MTFRSTFVEMHSSKEKALAPYHRAPVPLLQINDSLRWGSLSGFAAERGLHVEYVGNCWIRVVVDSGQLRQFLTDAAGLDGEARLASVVPDLKGRRTGAVRQCLSRMSKTLLATSDPIGLASLIGKLD